MAALEAFLSGLRLTQASNLLVNLITPISTVTTSRTSTINQVNLSRLTDGQFDQIYDAGANVVAGDWIQIDLGSSKDVKTIFTHVNVNDSALYSKFPEFNVYISNNPVSAGDGVYNHANNVCENSWGGQQRDQAGFLDCQTSVNGRYIIIEARTRWTGVEMKFSEIQAYSNTQIGQASPILSSLVNLIPDATKRSQDPNFVSSAAIYGDKSLFGLGSLSGGETRAWQLFGEANGVSNCQKFTLGVQNQPIGFNINFDSNETGPVEHILLQFKDTHNLSTSQITLVSETGVETDCGQVDMSAQTSPQVTQNCYGLCTTGAKFQATLNSGETEFRICKFGYFEDKTPVDRTGRDPLSATSQFQSQLVLDSSTQTYYTTFDLLDSVDKLLTLPIDPNDPCKISWSLRPRGQSEELLSPMNAINAVFAVNETQLTIKHITDPINFTLRKQLRGSTDRHISGVTYGTQQYDLVGTYAQVQLPDAVFPFDIYWRDDCYTNSILLGNVPAFQNFAWMGSPIQASSQTAAFMFGLALPNVSCGQLQIQQRTPSLAYASIGPTLFEIDAPLTVSYDQSQATESDIVANGNSFQYRVSLIEYPSVAVLDSFFQVVINCPSAIFSSLLDTSVSPAVSTYNIQNGAVLELNQPSMSVNPAHCFSMTNQWRIRDSITMLTPSFISVQSNGKILVQTNDLLDVGDHSLKIEGLASDGSYLQEHSFIVKIVNEQQDLAVEIPSPSQRPVIDASTENEINTESVIANPNIIKNYYKAPVLEPAPLEVQFFEQTDQIMIALAEVIDHQTKESSKTDISVDLGLAATFLTYDKESKTLVQKDQSTVVGSYIIQVDVATSGYEADVSKTTTYKTQIVIMDTLRKKNQELQKQAPIQQLTDFESLRSKLASFGQKSVKQTIEEQRNERQQSYLEGKSAQEARIVDMTADGEIKLAFAQPVEVPDGALEKINEQIQGLESKSPIQVVMTSDEVSQDTESAQSPVSSNLESWGVKDLNEDGLTIKMNFKEPLNVSQNDEADRVFVQFNLSSLNVQSKDQMLDGYITSSMVPTQSEAETETAQLDDIGILGFNAIIGVLVASLTIKIFRKISLSNLWAMIDGLQIISFIPLFKSKVPGNAHTIITYVIEAATFELIDVSDWNAMLFHFPEIEPFSLQFMECGFEDVFIIPGLGFVFYVLVAYICGILIHAFLSMCTRLSKNESSQKKCCASMTAKIGKLIYWNPLLLFFTEGFLDFCFWTMLTILTISEANSTVKEIRDVIINEGLIYMTSVLLIAVPPAIIVLYLKKHDKWTNEQEFQEKYGTLLEGAHTDWKERKNLILLLPSFFYLRRAIFAMTCIFMHSFFWGQIAVSFLLTTTALIGLEWNLPYQEKSQTQIESMNETFTLIALTMAMMFSDFVPNPWTRYQVGHALNSVIFLHIAIHLGINLVHIAKTLISWIKEKFLKCKRKPQTSENPQEIQNPENSENPHNIEVVSQNIPLVQQTNIAQQSQSQQLQIINEASAVEEQDQESLALKNNSSPVVNNIKLVTSHRKMKKTKQRKTIKQHPSLMSSAPIQAQLEGRRQQTETKKQKVISRPHQPPKPGEDLVKHFAAINIHNIVSKYVNEQLYKDLDELSDQEEESKTKQKSYRSKVLKKKRANQSKIQE